MEQAKKLLHESNVDFAHAGIKGSAGFAASFATMTINDWMGFMVGLATFIYMCFQIEAAWKKRKAAARENE